MIGRSPDLGDSDLVSQRIILRVAYLIDGQVAATLSQRHRVGTVHEFDPAEALGLLDWGRGVWTYDNVWYWAAAQGHQAGHVVGLNLGYGFGDTTAASENMS